MKNTMRGFAAIAMVVALLVPVDIAEATTSSYCGIRWGSVIKTGGNFERYARLTHVRAGRHGCFDRLVIDLKGGHEFYHVGYVDQVRIPEGGPVVPLRGGARLSVFLQAHTWDSQGRPTYRPANPAGLVDVSGWRTFRQVALAYSFEYGTAFGVGVRARLPFRVFNLPSANGGSRLVVDVAHRW